MSTELIAIISVGVTVAGFGVAVVGLLLTIEHRLRKEMRDKFETQRVETQAEFKTQRAETQTEFKTVRGEIQTLRTETQDEFKDVRTEMQEEFKTQRETTTNLLGRMAHVEGLLEGLREAFAGWRLDAVAEDPEEYDPRGGGAESKLTGSE